LTTDAGRNALGAALDDDLEIAQTELGAGHQVGLNAITDPLWNARRQIQRVVFADEVRLMGPHVVDLDEASEDEPPDGGVVLAHVQKLSGDLHVQTMGLRAPG
jgi:hypothetical protein